VDFQAAGDAGFGEAALEQAEDVVLASGEFHAGAFASLGSAKDDTLGTASGESFLGALRNEVALNFGGEAKGKGEDFGTDVRAEAVVVLEGEAEGGARPKQVKARPKGS